MTTKAQQSSLDNALVALENQRVIGKCNMMINPGMKPKEHTYQVDTVNKYKASYRFKIDNKRFSVNVEVFREILNIYPRISGQEFDEPLTEDDALSFIYELGHFGKINYIIEGMHYKKNLDFVALIWKDLAYQIDNKDTKKQDKMLYPIFTNIIIHHFLKKDKSISMRNKTFMHTTRDDSLLGVEPTKSKKHKTISKSAISSEETPSKKKPTKAKKDVPSKKKAASKPKRTNKKAPIKARRGKGLNVLSEVALSEAAQLKEATKQSKKDFHISQASGLGNGTDFELGVLDEQQRKTPSADEGTGTKPGVLDVPKYDSESDKEYWGDSGEEYDDDEEEDDTKDDEGNDDVDDSDGNDDDDDNDEDGEENKEDSDNGEELYKYVNVNLRKEDVEMTDANQGGADQHIVSQESRFEHKEEDAHVTRTTVHDTQKTKADNEIASLMDTTVRTEEPSGQTSTLFIVPITTIPLTPHFFNLPTQQTTPTPPPTTSEATTSFPVLLDFAFVFRFKDRVTNLERELSDNEASNNDEQLEDEAAPKNDWLRKLEQPLTPDLDWSKRQHVNFPLPQTWSSVTARVEKPPTSFDELTDTPIDFFEFFMNQLIITNLTQVLLVGPTFNLLKGGKLSRHYSTSVTKTKAATYKIKWIEDMILNLWSPVKVVYEKHAYRVTRLKIMNKYDYGQLDEIEVRKEDQQLYTFKEGDFIRLRLQHIEDILIVIQRRVEDLQLGGESNQKKLNLTKLDTVRSNLRNRTAYTAYSDRQGAIYKDQNNINRFMHTDKLQKFSDDTLNDVRTALYDITSGIRMEYLPKRKWSGLDKRRVQVMIHNIDKLLFERRLIKNLKNFVDGREYGNNLKLLEWTI
nr:hypothetical protein [Tanacetum cinerariifolium]